MTLRSRGSTVRSSRDKPYLFLETNRFLRGVKERLIQIPRSGAEHHVGVLDHQKAEGRNGVATKLFGDRSDRQHGEVVKTIINLVLDANLHKLQLW